MKGQALQVGQVVQLLRQLCQPVGVQAEPHQAACASQSRRQAGEGVEVEAQVADLTRV